MAVLPDPTGPALPSSAAAHGTLTRLRSRLRNGTVRAGAARREKFEDFLAAGLAKSFHRAPEGLLPRFDGAGRDSVLALARVALPDKAGAAWHLEDEGTGMSVDVALAEARDVAAQAADGYLIYPGGHSSGATLLHRALPQGLEDFLSFEKAPEKAAIEYTVTLGKSVAGLRLVAGILEMLDAGGAPRLRVAAPYLVDAKGVRVEATLAVVGCAVDTNPAFPWGRPVTPPGETACSVRVTWDEADVRYPAVLDPSWTTTGNMTTVRQDHTAVALTGNRVLVAGGRITPTTTTGLATAEIFDKASGTWAATGSMTGGRWFHAAVLLGSTASTTTSGKVLVAGGINGTTSLATAQLFDPTPVTGGTWVAAGTMNTGGQRHLHTATLLANGKVLVAGGMNGTTILNTAATFDPASGAGSWTAVGNMTSARRFHTATLLSSTNTNFNGKVLIAGGNSSGTTSVSTADLFSGTSFTATTALPGTREGHTVTALVSTTGKVLVTGGRSGTTTLGSTFVFTIPSSGTTATWPSAGTMATRQAHTATLLPSSVLNSGQVLVAGGSNGTSSLATAQLWDGNTTWNTTTALPAAVQGQTATLVGNMVLLAGGANGSSTVNFGRLYDPSNGLTCTTGTQCASGFCANGVCCDSACNQGCGVCNQTGNVGKCVPKGSGTCRMATGTCDVTESCNATSVACPTDAFAANTTLCRDAAAGGCDVKEFCTGTSATCPPDVLAPSTTVCRPAPVGGCDVEERCTGTSTTCPVDQKAADNAACDDGALCTTGDRCAAGVCGGSQVVCPAWDVCHGGGTCNQTTGACSAPAANEGGTCNDGNSCSQGDHCVAGDCVGTQICAQPPYAVIDDLDTTVGGSVAPFGINSAGVTTGSETAPSGRSWAWRQSPATGMQAISFTDSQMAGGFAINATGTVAGTTIFENAGAGAAASSRAASAQAAPVGGGATTTSFVQASSLPFGWQWWMNLVVGATSGGGLGGGQNTPDSVSTTPGWGAGTQYPFSAASGQTATVFSDAAGWANGINDAGDVVGIHLAGSPRAFRIRNGTRTILPLPAGADIMHAIGFGIGPASSSQPTGFRASETVGYAQSNEGTHDDGNGSQFAFGWGVRKAFRHDDTSGAKDLNIDPAVTSHPEWGILYHANATNGRQITGWGVKRGRCRAFRLTPGVELVDLGVLVGTDWELGDACVTNGFHFYQGNGVNSRGDVVGTVGTANWPERAFYYSDATGIIDLNILIDPSLGYTLVTATGINDNGEIAGSFVKGSDPRWHGYRMKLPDSVLSPGTGWKDIAPRIDGIVDVGVENGQQKYVALFGYTKTVGTPDVVLMPGVGSNDFVRNGSRDLNPTPSPPTRFQAGNHIGAFQPKGVAGDVFQWTVAGKQKYVTISPSATLTHVPIGTNGYGVKVPDPDHPGQQLLIPIKPDTGEFETPPAEPTVKDQPAVGGAYDGALSGTLSVTPSGAATYTVPISIPPSVAGMAPNLNLVYNSQVLDGIAGRGWELSGLSAIHRCRKTVVQDGIARPIQMNPLGEQASDGLCIDGKKLFSKPGGGGLVVEDNDFSSIYAYAANGVSGFAATTRTGETRYYGLRSDSRVEMAARDAGQTEVAVWALERVKDQWGNYYDLHYNTDHSSRGLILLRIDYTGHIVDDTYGSTHSPAEPTFAFIQFAYEGRPDQRNIRFGKTTLPRNQRLTSITTNRGVYTLTYEQDNLTLPSRLHEIAYATTTQPVVRPKSLVFTWDANPVGWSDYLQTRGYELPVSIAATRDQGVLKFNGTQFVDIDGDGRADLVHAKEDEPIGAWRNLGTTSNVPGDNWKPMPTWELPTILVKANGSRAGAMFADVDGDGMQDLIFAGGGETRSCTCGTRVGPLCIGSSCIISGPRPIQVWLNRFKAGLGWVRSTAAGLSGLETAPNSAPWPEHPIDLSTTDTLADLNGDGRIDIVHFNSDHSGVDRVLLNQGNAWLDSAEFNVDTAISNLVVADVNGDGRVDMTRPNGGLALLNTYDPSQGANAWQVFPNPDETLGAANDVRLRPDLDGDGLQDVLVPHVDTHSPPVLSLNFSAMAFATGAAGYSTEQINGYAAAFDAYGPPKTYTSDEPTTGPDGQAWVRPDSYYLFKFVDLNADGLADIVWNHTGGGVFLVNTGRAWTDTIGLQARPEYQGSKWYVQAGANATPVVPSDTNGATFIDLNGDGVTDWVYSTGSTSHAVLNTFRPPVIRLFPSGLAPDMEVKYEVITTADAQTPKAGEAVGTYYDDGARPASTAYLAAPLRVVESVLGNTGQGSVNSTRHRYTDLRSADPTSLRGPQGFYSMTVIRQDGIKTTTTFGQQYPFTSRPVAVSTVDSGGGTMSETTTEYCFRDPIGGAIQCAAGSVAPQTALFVFPHLVTDTNYLRTGLAEPTSVDRIMTTTESTYDTLHGNLTSTVVQTDLLHVDASGPEPVFTVTERRVSSIENTYGGSGSTEERLGKITATIAKAQQLIPSVGPETRHTTSFEYVSATSDVPTASLALKRKVVEPSAPEAIGVRLDTVYAYDGFGNVIATTNCANDFGSCDRAGATSPNAAKPFRTTEVSYETSDFQPSVAAGLVTSLSYGPGRFPVRTRNAAGHSEFTAYDPLLGVVVQTTGPNSVTTCFEYDGVGRVTKQTDRCGASGHEVVTAIHRFMAGSGAPEFAANVSVSEPATGTSTWTYADTLGRTVGTLTRSFDGNLIATLTSYDRYGRVGAVAKPYIRANEVPVYATTEYDQLGRAWRVTDNLGAIDGTSSPTLATTTLTFSGTTVVSTRNVAGTPRSRAETKNLLGKVASVTENQVTTYYTYDADGNLQDTSGDPARSVHAEYDLGGRKVLSKDPDMGQWTYEYNGFGELVAQTDALHQRTEMTYDSLGRMTSKTEAVGTSGAETAYWFYDVGPGAKGKLAATVSGKDGRLNGTCVVGNSTVNDGKRAGRSYSYNSLGELAELAECVDGGAFTTTYGYDNLGRQATITYPQVGADRLAVGYHYNVFGYLQYVESPADHRIYWAATGMNALGQVTKEITRNGIETVATRNPATGWLQGSTSTAKGDGNRIVQAWSYRYDEAGNLRYRDRTDQVNLADAHEIFTYDLLDRLKTSEVKVPGLGSYDVTDSVDYDDYGNITTKGLKNYSYGGCGGPHAVCSVTGVGSYTYDVNGNMRTGAGRSITYNVANKVSRITTAPDVGTVDFIYGSDGNRVVQVAAGSTESARTVYVGLGNTGRSLYERTTHTAGGSTTTEHTQFIYAGGYHQGNAFALRVTKDTAAPAFRYYGFDHLGSVTAMSDEFGKVVDSAGSDAGVLGYDPWGSRRNPEGRAAGSTMFPLNAGHREFTGHETIPGLGLVNMNGRIYDPGLGRFFSPDPNVQFAANLQSFNRYSYVLNNPLKYADPTGYFSLSQGFFMNLFMGAATFGCMAGPQALGCVAAFTIGIAVVNIMFARAEGASWDQAVIPSLTSAGFGLAFGGLGGELASELGGQWWAQVIGGGVGGAIGAAMSTALAGGSASALGENVLIGALSGAAMAGVSYGLRNAGATSEAEAMRAQAHGIGGSGAARVEKSAAQMAWEIDEEIYRGLEAYDGRSGDAVAMELPADPSGLDSDWVVDPTHRDPNGTRVRHPSGDYLDFHKGREGAPGWRGEDHWHWNGQKPHLEPGAEIPDPTPVSRDPKHTPGPTIDETPKPPAETPPKGNVPFMPLPLGPPPVLPLPIFEPLPIPIFI